jgi:nickel transport protein
MPRPHLALAATMLLAAHGAQAHSVGARVDPQGAAVVIAFAYGGGDPIAFGDVTVTAPDGRVHQKGRADRAGRFAVAIPPDAPPGDWTAQIDDGQGHQTRLRFAADSPARIAAIRDSTARGLGLVAVVLLLTNLVLVGLLAARRRPA